MRIEIDQSGKVEYTSSVTVVADSLGNSILIKAEDKRIIQHLYREWTKPRKFVMELFAALIVILIMESHDEINQYTIDIEYPGQSVQIKSYIIKFLSNLGQEIKSSSIEFDLVGKLSKSHEAAYKRFKKKTTGKTVTVEDILNIIQP